MNRLTRNALAELLHEALNDPEAAASIELLHTLCKYFRIAPVDAASVPDLLRIADTQTHRSPEHVLQTILRLVATGRLLRICSARGCDTAPPPVPTPERTAGWLAALAPEAHRELEVVEERLQAYRGVLDLLSGGDRNGAGGASLRQAWLWAAACFNAGLFFEAHEILEGHWVDLSEGPLRRFLQGVIQISVGFHHAREGRFFGTLNQLGKGPEKTLGGTEVVSALDWQRFVAEVRAIREQLLARGPLRVGRLFLQDIPRMPLPFDR